MSAWLAHPAVEELKRFWRPAACAAAALVWLATGGSPSLGVALVHYLALATLAGVLIGWAATHSVQQRGTVLWVGGIAVVLLIVAYAHRETYLRRWKDSVETEYEDRVRRWGGTIEYRRLRRVADEGLAWSEGPMREGKRHGRWERHEQRPPKVEPQWYWNDKPVSEAEWQRLNLNSEVK